MRLSDPHCHLYFENYDNDRDEVIQRAYEAGVEFMISIGIDAESNMKSRTLAESHRNIYFTTGWHPHYADADPDSVLESVESSVSHPLHVAIGEIGLDYYRNSASVEGQKRLFHRLALLAAENRKPCVLHSRDAFDDTMEILSDVRSRYPEFKAVFHCYTYDAKCLERVIQNGFMVSFTGIVTFKSAADLRQAAREVPDNCFMVETDAPYLAPVPFRGKRNEPSMTADIVREIADLRGQDPEWVASNATDNAAEFFGVPKSQ